MSTLSVYSAEHLKLHVHRGGGRTGVFVSVLKKMLESADRAAATTVVLLTVVLGVFAFMQIGEAGRVIASYSDLCRVLPTLFSLL
jgi:spore maturation protein SpmA